MRCLFFFFKQKTAYEMRISDWSSDVCSSDLIAAFVKRARRCVRFDSRDHQPAAIAIGDRIGLTQHEGDLATIGRESKRARHIEARRVGHAHVAQTDEVARPDRPCYERESYGPPKGAGGIRPRPTAQHPPNAP